ESLLKLRQMMQQRLRAVNIQRSAVFLGQERDGHILTVKQPVAVVKVVHGGDDLTIRCLFRLRLRARSNFSPSAKPQAERNQGASVKVFRQNPICFSTSAGAVEPAL